MRKAIPKAEQDPAVIVSDLSVKFGDFYAVKGIDFSVNSGEIFGFLGANGAGKTTTIRVLCGLLYPSSGNVKIKGIEFNDKAPENIDRSIKTKVGYMSQRFTLYNDLTVEENLSFTASLRKLSKTLYKKRRDYLLQFISYRHSLNDLVRNLSGGIKQQVSLAASILHDPEIIFLDEPTAGVTPATRARFWQLIKQLAKEGKTVFVTTHYMDEAENCDRIALMSNGEILALGSPAQLKKQVFPDLLYEFEIKGEEQNYALLKKLQADPNLEYFEPFGLRFHAAFKQTPQALALKESLMKKFNIKTISPSLEDVFIKMVEGKGNGSQGQSS